jgi:hypothetical protein
VKPGSEPFEEALVEIQKLLYMDLIRLLGSGQASPSDRNVARQLLKDNGITIEPRVSEKDLTDRLEEFVDPENLRFNVIGTKCG